jgi:hypothetical protein
MLQSGFVVWTKGLRLVSFCQGAVLLTAASKAAAHDPGLLVLALGSEPATPPLVLQFLVSCR